MTVDREVRNRLALALRRLATGRMLNYDFDDRYYARWKSSPDLAVSEIAKFAWGLYSSDRACLLKGRYALSPEQKGTVARAILFLRTDHEYQWPPEPEIHLGWLLAPFGYLLLWIAVLWALYTSAKSSLWELVLVCLPLVPIVYWSLGRIYWKKGRAVFLQSGDNDVWPFLRLADFEKARGKGK